MNGSFVIFYYGERQIAIIYSFFLVVNTMNVYSFIVSAYKVARGRRPRPLGREWVEAARPGQAIYLTGGRFSCQHFDRSPILDRGTVLLSTKWPRLSMTREPSPCQDSFGQSAVWLKIGRNRRSRRGRGQPKYCLGAAVLPESHNLVRGSAEVPGQNAS